MKQSSPLATHIAEQLDSVAVRLYSHLLDLQVQDLGVHVLEHPVSIFISGGLIAS